jgi:hypothetical protein
VRRRRHFTQRADELLTALEHQQRVRKAPPEWQAYQRIQRFVSMALERKMALVKDKAFFSFSESERKARLEAVDREVDALKTPEDREIERRWRTKYDGHIAGARELLLQKLIAMRSAIQQRRKEKGLEDDEDDQEES